MCSSSGPIRAADYVIGIVSKGSPYSMLVMKTGFAQTLKSPGK